MDIDYLLLLQDFRNGINDAITPFMEAISYFAIAYLTIIPAFIYWCLDKKNGLYTISSLYVCQLFNAVIKLTACVYRPWIRDSRVLPAGDSIRTATGYSFPSGHTMMAASQYGGIAVGAWKKLRWISVLCIVFTALTGFSRNYLGVHTPQDVLVGLAVSALVMWGMAVLFRYLTAHPEKENIFLAAGFVIGIGAMIYISVKPYPMDFVEDTLLVDPQKMIRDGYTNIGAFMVFCIARFIEKTWIKFEPKMTKENLSAGLVGAVITYFLMETVYTPAEALFGKMWGPFAGYSVILLFIITVWPAVMKAIQKKSEKAQPKADTE